MNMFRVLVPEPRPLPVVHTTATEFQELKTVEIDTTLTERDIEHLRELDRWIDAYMSKHTDNPKMIIAGKDLLLSILRYNDRAEDAFNLDSTSFRDIPVQYVPSFMNHKFAIVSSNRDMLIDRLAYEKYGIDYEPRFDF